jgi:hypothetical protein
MKRVVFLLHGVGRHDEKWSLPFQTRFKALIKALEVDGDFDPDPLLEELENTEFVELWYDDLYQKFVKVMLEREAEFIAALKFAGLTKLAKAFTTDSAEEDLVRDNIFDILLYRVMPEHRLMTRKKLALAMMATVQEHGTDDVEYTLVAHSLGTAIAHDTLQEMATEKGSPLRLGLTFTFRNLMMLANTSALLRNDFDPRESAVRPFVAPGDPGYVRFYWNFSHKWDPIAQIYGYEGYMKGQPSKRYNYTTISHFQAANIHAITHYLNDPAVHFRIFSGIYGKELVPDAYVKAMTQELPSKKLSEKATEALIAKLRPAVEPGGPPDADARSAGLIAIAKLLQEIV